MPEPIAESLKNQLREVHSLALRMHKLLMDAERAAWEAERGPVKPVEMLQLLLSHERFAWLRTISALLADIDGALSPRRPGSREDGEMLVARSREVFTAAETGNEFQRNYYRALQEDPDVLVLHGQIRRHLDFMR